MGIHSQVFTDNQLQELTNSDNDTIVVYPILTGYAYTKHGFYEYYNNICDEKCLTVPIFINATKLLKTDIGTTYWIHPQEETSNSAYRILTQLNYHFITDIDIDRNPKILDRYNKIILLHNEYITEKEFNAIKNHQNVMYLYANAIYAQVSLDYNNSTMTLIRGHGYPKTSMLNGFNYFTSSQHEYDFNCKDLPWKSRPNGISLSCYPELEILENQKLLKDIHDWPNKPLA